MCRYVFSVLYNSMYVYFSERKYSSHCIYLCPHLLVGWLVGGSTRGMISWCFFVDRLVEMFFIVRGGLMLVMLSLPLNDGVEVVDSMFTFFREDASWYIMVLHCISRNNKGDMLGSPLLESKKGLNFPDLFTEF